MRKSEIQHIGSGGSAVPILNKGHFSQLQIALPPLKEQQAIACILGALDDKIELNQRVNRTLEAMAQAIFKSWFVDFDPVRAKATGCAPGLPKKIADLFPDSFQDAELGEIPKGWKAGQLSDVVTHVIDRVQPSVETTAIPYVPIECIASRSICLYKSQPGKNARSSLVRFRQGDILFGAMRPYFHKVCIAPFAGTTRTTAFVLRPQPSELAFAALVVNRDETIAFATSHSEGSTIPYAKWSNSLETMGIMVPPCDLRQSFHQIVEPMLFRMMDSVNHSHTIEAIRDALLPRLISGELPIPDAERIVERCS
jgi:type I restriction enzyme, S subunit